MDIFAGDPRAVETDLLITGLFEGEAPPAVWSLATDGETDRAVASREFCGKLFEIFFTPIAERRFAARRLAFVGLGPRLDFTVDRARRVASAIGLAARAKKI
jgi:hypothetical protein